MSFLKLFIFCTPPLLAAFWLLIRYKKITGKNAAKVSLISVVLSCGGFFLPQTTSAQNELLIRTESALLSLLFVGLILVIGAVALLTAHNDESDQNRSSNYYAFLLFFIISMILTVCFSDFRLFFISW